MQIFSAFRHGFFGANGELPQVGVLFLLSFLLLRKPRLGADFWGKSMSWKNPGFFKKENFETRKNYEKWVP